MEPATLQAGAPGVVDPAEELAFDGMFPCRAAGVRLSPHPAR
eukprot:SAG25_NODE_7206_length_496_cov_1.166247_2_plen_41_part_01